MSRHKAAFALFAVFALFAAASPVSASASEFKAGEYTATLTGSQVAGEKLEFIFGASGNANCETASLGGSIAAAAGTVTLHPTFGGACSALTFANASLNTTGCDFKFYSEGEFNPGAFSGSMDIVCSVGSKIKLVAGTCEAEIKEVNALALIEYFDMPAGGGSPEDLTIKFFVSSLPYTVTKDGLGCPFFGTGNFTNGSIRGKETVTAAVTGVPKSFSVS